MATPRSAFAAVAAALSAVDPSDDVAVETFYRTQFVEFPEVIRVFIADFLVAATENPSEDDIARLKEAVAGPIENVPSPAFPVWDERFGPEMEY